MNSRGEASRWRWAVMWRVIGAAVVFLFTAVYRFNTLGGTFGGLDNDHFVPFAYAKQVEAGAQPLRDFAGLGLQGAWPSLTFEVSAWGQRWFGDNLRSEALLTVIAVAAAATITFIVAALLSNAFWAAVATAVSVFVAPTLYNYPKVLLLSAAALTIVFCARRANVAAAAAAAVLTAIAFLFRHDYAVFAGVGILLAYLVAWGRSGIRHGAIYAGLTVLLLTPSVVYIQRYAGIPQYLRDSVGVSQREAERTGLSSWPAFTMLNESGERATAATFFSVEQNGASWLYYLVRVLPLAVAGLVWRDRETDRRAVRAAALAIAGMAAFASPFLIRGNVAVRLGDVGPMFSVLLAIVCAEAMRRSQDTRVASRVGRTALLIVVLVPTALSAATVGYVESQLTAAGLSQSWGATRIRTRQLLDALARLPHDALLGEQEDDPFTVSRYINRCTTPSDRIVMMAYEPQTLPYAGRLFGAGRLSVIPKYILSAQNETELVGFWRRETVPLVFVEFDEFVSTTGDAFPLIRSYLREHYHQVGSLGASESKALRVYARNDRAPVSTFGSQQLPCFG